MRTLGSLLLVVPLTFGGCSAIDDFSQFKIGDGGAAADLGGGCSAGCTCIAADATLGVPEHCALAPSNNLTCTSHNADTVTLSGAYVIDTGDPAQALVPPSITGPGVNVNGSVQNGVASFCVGSLVTTAASQITVKGRRPLAILADSNIQLIGSITLSGGYAIDENGAAAGPGGTAGGNQATAAVGTSGGKGGVTAVGSMGSGGGTGGSGGGGAVTGGAGGAATGAGATAGGVAIGSGNPPIGYGGGGGGSGQNGAKGGGGGGGGGVMQLSAGWQLSLAQVSVDASGGGGAGGGLGAQGAGGGGAGGSGGSLLLESPNLTLTGGCLSVIGGPGGGGGSPLARGGDAKGVTACGFQGSKGAGGAAVGTAGGGGGDGAAATVNVAAGGNAAGIAGGGGGAGSYGRVVIRTHTPPSATDSGVVPQAAYTSLTL